MWFKTDPIESVLKKQNKKKHNSEIRNRFPPALIKSCQKKGVHDQLGNKKLFLQPLAQVTARARRV